MLRTNASTQTPLIHSRPPLHTDPRSPLTTSSAVILSELRKAERRILTMLGVFSRKGEEEGKKRAAAGKSGSTSMDEAHPTKENDNKDKGGGVEFDDGNKPRLLRELLPIHLLDLHFANGGNRGLSSSSDSDSSGLDDEDSDSDSHYSAPRRRQNGADREGEYRHRHTSPLRSRVAPRKVGRLPAPAPTPTPNLTAKGGITDVSGGLSSSIRNNTSGASTFEADAYACDDAVLRSFAAIKVAQSFQQCERAIAEQLEFMRIISEEQALAAAGNARSAALKECAMLGGQGALSIVKEPRGKRSNEKEVATPTNSYQQPTNEKSSYDNRGGETDARKVKTTPPSTPIRLPERESRMVVVSSGAYATVPTPPIPSADETNYSQSSQSMRTMRRESGRHEMVGTKATFTTSTSSRRGSTAVEHAWGQLAALSTSSSFPAPAPSEGGHASISVLHHGKDTLQKSKEEAGGRMALLPSSGGESAPEKVFEGVHQLHRPIHVGGGQVFVPPLPTEAAATATGIVSMPPAAGRDIHQGDSSSYMSRSVSAVTSVSGATNSAISPAASVSASLARVAEDGSGGQGSMWARGTHGAEVVGVGPQHGYRQEGGRTLGANSSSDRDPRLSPPPTNHNSSRHVYGHLADGSAGGVRILGGGHQNTNSNPSSQVQGADRPRDFNPPRDEGTSSTPTPTTRSTASIAVIPLQTPPVPMVTSHRARNYMAHLERVLSAADDAGDDDSVFF